MDPGSALAVLACPGRRGWNCLSIFIRYPSSPGLTGRSSIPEAAVLEPRSRGVLDHPHARVMTASMWRLRCHFQTLPRLLAARMPEVCTLSLAKQREQGMPGARCTRGLVCKVAQRKAHTSIQVQRRQSGIPCAMALRLMPCSPRRRILFVTVASGLRLVQARLGRRISAGLTSATDARTTRFCRTQQPPFVLRAVYRSRVRSRPAITLRADAAASTASHPAFVTIAIRPSCRVGRRKLVELICPTAKAKYFSKRDWTGFCSSD
jgi:hypothetical protein